MTEYKLVVVHGYREDGPSRLQSEVNELLKDGWQAQGGIAASFSNDGHRLTWAQALLRERRAEP